MDIKNLSNIQKIEYFSGKLKGKKVFLRADFNVPIQEGKITDTYRIDSTMKTFAFLKKEGAVTIVVSHIETKGIDKPTLALVFEYIQKQYPEYSIVFCENFLNQNIVEKFLYDSKEGDFILFENIRHADIDGLSEKGDDQAFAEYLKQFAEYYIQDAFAVSHRKHTSVSALAKLFDRDHKVAGYQLHEEIVQLQKTLQPIKPLAVILSGAKFSTKLPLIEKYLETADTLFVGGALLNNILKSLGYEVGVSLIDKDASYVDMLVKKEIFNKKVFIPEYVVVQDSVTKVVRESHVKEVKSSESILDIAMRSVWTCINVVTELDTKTILWNGPIGNFELKPFDQGTNELAKLLLTYVQSDPLQEVHVYIGGGDTVSAIQNIEDVDTEKNIFISTGGGAMLEFLEKEGELPGIVSLM